MNAFDFAKQSTLSAISYFSAVFFASVFILLNIAVSDFL